MKRKTSKESPTDTAMLSIAVGDVLARAWGENDPTIDKVVRAVNRYQEAEDELASLREVNRILLEAAKRSKRVLNDMNTDNQLVTAMILSLQNVIVKAEGNK